jgi:uncharacterized membrane protein YhaH (DUF805 family)
MSKPVFQDLFKFSGRRNRKSYILLCLSQLVAFAVFATVGFFGIGIADDYPVLGWPIALASFGAFVATGVTSWAAGSQRIRDTGHSGVWILLCLLPYVGWVVALGICCIPGTRGENEYGPSCIE